MKAHRDYIPSPDGEFDGFQSNYVNALTANLAAWGISALNADYVDLLAKHADWTAKYAAGNKEADRKPTQVKAKQSSRRAYEAALRLFNKRYIVFNPALADADRVKLNITIPDRVRTLNPAPHYAPMASVHKIEHGLHELRIVDPHHPDTREMPNSWHVQIWVAVLPAGSTAGVPDDAAFNFLANASRFNYSVRWDAHSGATAFYYVVYENTRGKKGPVSHVFSGVIA